MVLGDLQFKHTIYVNGVMLDIVVEKLLKCREMLNTVNCIIFWLWKGGGEGGNGMAH